MEPTETDAVSGTELDRRDGGDDIDGLVDTDVLASWMDGRQLPGGPIEDLETLTGGTQNALVAFRRGGRDYVLRRGPRHLRKASNEVMRREMRVLECLNGSDVPHPQFIAGCPDEQVMGGAAFYLMARVDGFNATVSLPDLHAHDKAVQHEMGLSVADAAASLGTVDYEAVGLGDFGRPDGFLERQVPRWRSELESYGELDGYPGPEIPGLDDVGAWLESNRPETWSAGIMHGDYHLANVLFAPDGPDLAAVVDWEMCTIGDPLLDLGWMLATWPSRDHPAAAAVTGRLSAADGLPRTEELVERYAAQSDRDLSSIDWYTVLACFKLGIVLEGTYARALAGKASMATGELLHAITLGLFARATTIIETSS
jgi:aminoglycoside phosphotransferase (APT) family kinase protein